MPYVNLLVGCQTLISGMKVAAALSGAVRHAKHGDLGVKLLEDFVSEITREGKECADVIAASSTVQATVNLRATRSARWGGRVAHVVSPGARVAAWRERHLTRSIHRRLMKAWD